MEFVATGTFTVFIEGGQVMGPFDVPVPESAARLGTAFAPFVNDLLSAEVGRAGMLGHQLEINTQLNRSRWRCRRGNRVLVRDRLVARRRDSLGSSRARTSHQVNTSPNYTEPGSPVKACERVQA